MGSWNGTCAISNLHITHGTKVAVFILLENKDKKTFCYNNAAYDICPVPFYGEYNDYGGVENYHGFGLNLVVEAIKNNLYEFGQGPNPCHDCVVNRDNFDIEKLFEADGEDRLGIQFTNYFNNDEYDKRELEQQRLESGLTNSQMFELDRLVNKIKKVDNFRRITHVIVHGDVFDSILQKWYIEQYVGKNKGTYGYDKSYVKVYFKDIIDSIPEFIDIEKLKFQNGLKFNRYLRGGDWNNPNLAVKWLNNFDSSNRSYGLIDVREYIMEYISNQDWNGLEQFAKEVLTTAWINCFMEHTRKLWTQQCGMGSQRNNPDGYILLADTVKDILKAEYAEYIEENGEEEIE